MRKLVLAALVTSVFISCEKEEPNSYSFSALNDKVLEVTDIEAESNSKSDLFNDNVSGIKFNSDMTYVLLDKNYGDNNSWKQTGSANNWSLDSDNIILESEHND